MRTLYIECKMGAAGDMLMAALYELLSEEQQKQFLYNISHFGIEGVAVIPNRVQRCGIYGTQMQVLIHGEEEMAVVHHEHHSLEHTHTHTHHHEHEHHHHNHSHHHTSYEEIVSQISTFHMSDSVKEHAKNIYRIIGEAEAKAHDTKIEQIHFHEVGSLDAIVDVIGCSMLIEMLDVDQVIVSPIHVGNGTVECAHGILPVPAPATAHILLGIPYYSKDIMTELCTPTGASILKNYANAFQEMPNMVTRQIGYGMGKKELPVANCIRVFLGETEEKKEESIIEIRCNLDDMTAEEMGYAVEVLLNEGALDVFTSPIMMKKNRPATLFTCLCKRNEREKFVTLILKHTSTLGIRYQEYKRNVLTSTIKEVETTLGTVHIKESIGYGVQKMKLEYEDMKGIADKTGKDMMQIKKQLMKEIK